MRKLFLSTLLIALTIGGIVSVSNIQVNQLGQLQTLLV